MLLRNSWLDAMLFLVACLLSLLLVAVQPSFLFAESDEAFRMRVQMALLQKQREKERDVTGLPTRFFSLVNRDQAAEKAFREDRPLVLWVGMTCGDAPELRVSLATAVHCLVPENGGNTRPRVILVNPADYSRGTTWNRGEIDATTAAQIMRAYRAQKAQSASNRLPLVPLVGPTSFAPQSCPGGICPQP